MGIGSPGGNVEGERLTCFHENLPKPNANECLRFICGPLTRIDKRLLVSVNETMFASRKNVFFSSGWTPLLPAIALF